MTDLLLSNQPLRPEEAFWSGIHKGIAYSIQQIWNDDEFHYNARIELDEEDFDISFYDARIRPTLTPGCENYEHRHYSPSSGWVFHINDLGNCHVHFHRAVPLLKSSTHYEYGYYREQGKIYQYKPDSVAADCTRAIDKIHDYIAEECTNNS